MRFLPASPAWSRRVVSLACALLALVGTQVVARGDVGDPPATPQAECGPGSHPETGLQGRVSADDVASGRAAEGYRCNTEQAAHFGSAPVQGGSGGYRTYRYVDAAGNECAIYDSTLLFPLNLTKPQDLPGVFVLDMRDPANPIKTTNLLTPAMLSPHESMSLSEARGLLAAGMGYPTTNPGVVDLYDVSQDCLHPTLLSSTPMGILGHEGTFSPDGNTYWVTSTTASLITALDVSDPTLPRILWTTRDYRPHGLNISDDGNTLYLADTTPDSSGLTILDVSQVQARDPEPVVTEISHLTWDTVSIPQTAIPVVIGGHPYVIEVDEFARGLGAGDPSSPVGATRIIDIADPAAPEVVSDIRLEVHQRENIAEIAGDPGATFQVQGYAGHYCAVPQRIEPGIVACSMILSGLRVFDIRDPAHPVEIAYFNAPVPEVQQGFGGNHAMSAPAFAPERGEIWYTDGNSGFYSVRITNGVWPFAA